MEPKQPNGNGAERQQGGEIMPRYGDDQCVQCGGLRANKSSLCVDCLIKVNGGLQLRVELLEAKLERAWTREKISIKHKDVEIEGLKKRLRLRQKLLRHIFSEYQAVRNIKSCEVFKQGV